MTSAYRRLSALALFACALGAAAPAAANSELLRFQRECEQRLPPVSVTAVALPSNILYDFTAPVVSLTKRGKRQHALNQVVLGLTEVVLKHKVHWGGSMLVSPSGMACQRPKIEITLDVGPQKVSVGREFPQGSCAFNAIVQHELRHVYANQQTLEAAADFLEQEMRAYYGNRVFYGSKSQLNEQLDRDVRESWIPWVKHKLAEADVRHNAIDSPEEYAKNQTICGGAIPKTLSRM